MAAQKIQAISRGRRSRKDRREQEQAAGRIQAVSRGRKARKERLEQELAAQKIQAVSRGRRARRQHSKGKHLPYSSASERGEDTDVEEMNYQYSDEEEAALAAQKIQAISRGRRSRKEVANLKRVPTGAGFDHAEDPMDPLTVFDDDEAELAALKIQATARGRAIRKQRREEEVAVTKIQAVARGRKVRKSETLEVDNEENASNG